MKTRIILFLFCIYTIGAFNIYNGDVRQKKFIQWIKTHDKPIVCRALINSTRYDGRVVYTLISANNEFFNTGPIAINLPDTIK